jgi:hypothetical protein
MDQIHESTLQKEREKLKRLPTTTIAEYIKSTVDTIIDMKVEEKFRTCNKESNSVICEDYESLLRKLESDIRGHMKVKLKYNKLLKKLEHQFKLHAEGLQSRVDELEKELHDYKSKMKMSLELMDVIIFIFIL